MNKKSALISGQKPRSTDGIRDLSDLDSLVDLLSLVLDKVGSGIIVCDIKCRILFMNQVYGKLLGVDPHKTIGDPLNKYFPETRMPIVLSLGQPELGQKCSLRTELPMLVNRIPLKIKGRIIGVILQTVFRDYKAMTDLMSRLKALESEANHYKKGLERVLRPLYNFDSIIGESRIIRELKELAFKYSQLHAPVLINGPTGTGKELFSHSVHAASPRSSGPFVCVNCAAIPRELLEAELFGYVSGAFTGAKKKGKVGQIQLAHMGTLFLDEIGELSTQAQAKLLRVLETKYLDRLGDVQPLLVDFRLVAATNRDLQKMMRQGMFRDDLYYRLNTLSLTIPPLAKRPGDINLLVRHFLNASDIGELSVSEEAKQMLNVHGWPGNVRELKNVIERAVSLTSGNTIELEQLPPEVFSDCGDNTQMYGFSDSPLADEMARFEKSLLERALSINDGIMSKTSRKLGISRSTLYEKCRKHDIFSKPSKI